MRSISFKHFIIIAAALLLLLLCVPAVFFMTEKANLPLTVESNGKSVSIKSLHNGSPLSLNDKILSIEDIPVTSREDIEIILDSKRAGDTVAVKVDSGGTIKEVFVASVNFYSLRFIVLQLIAAIYFVLFGLFVLLKAKGNKAAELFCLASLGVAAILIMTWGRYNNAFDLTHVTRSVFQAAYLFTPILFVHFALKFPQDRSRKYRVFIISLYYLGTMLLILNIITFYNMLGSMNTDTIASYKLTFNFSRILLGASVFLSIIIFFAGYLKTSDITQKKKLKWLITGFLAGPLSFTLLWVIPQAITDYGLIPEEFLSILMISVPITFTISILKYHLLDIDVILNRSAIYFLIVAGIFLLYFGIVLTVTLFIDDVNQTLLSSISAVLVAFLFNPLKNYVHNFVNKKFFRTQYDFREAVKLFFSEMAEVYNIQTLANTVITGVCRFIPVEKIALIEISGDESIRALSWINFYSSDLHFMKENFYYNYDSAKILVLPEKVEGSGNELESESRLKEIKLCLVVFANPVNRNSRFILAAGNKKSGNRYTAEDVDLLLNIMNTASAIGARIILQEDLIRNELENEKLTELNKQRSLFVSTVSHDLKTPLTSIRMYSELIKMNNDDKAKICSYAEYIEGESERLTRLINNVLNFSCIEKGIMEYHKVNVDLNELVEKSISIMEYQLRIQQFVVTTDILQNEMPVYADEDAIIEALINLISNAIKYSLDKKEIHISSSENENGYIVSIRDCGIGIPEEEKDKLFTPFFRTEEAQALKIGGTGLGLSIIKHIAVAHNIKIEVDSKISQGTTINLIFPKIEMREKHEEHFVD
jgi:signal transduction histidine kinase